MVRMELYICCIVIALLASALPHACEVSAAELFSGNWCNAVIGEAAGSMKRNCVLELSFAASQRRVEAYLQRQGYVLYHQSERNRLNGKFSVAFWRKGNECIVTMLHSHDAGRTSLTWGDLGKEFDSGAGNGDNGGIDLLYQKLDGKFPESQSNCK